VKERVVAKRGASQAEKQPTSETARLEARIETARNDLAVAIDQIAERVAPANVAAEAKSKARGIVINADGSLRKDRVIKIAAVAGIVLAIGAWRRYR
jgi:biopolymer transport protein ExbD